MILVDANLLLYAYFSDYPQHQAARQWLEGVLNRPDRVGLAWDSLLAFLRISTNPRIFSRPAALPEVWKTVESWLARPNVWVPLPGPRHAEFLAQALDSVGRGGNHVPDAHLAALARQHGLKLMSCDSDFSRFAEIRWENPIV